MKYSGPVSLQVNGARDDPRAQFLVSQGMRMLGSLDAVHGGNPAASAVSRHWGDNDTGTVSVTWAPLVKSCVVTVPGGRGEPAPPLVPRRHVIRHVDRRELVYPLYGLCVQGSDSGFSTNVADQNSDVSFSTVSTETAPQEADYVLRLDGFKLDAIDVESRNFYVDRIAENNEVVGRGATPAIHLPLHYPMQGIHVNRQYSGKMAGGYDSDGYSYGAYLCLQYAACFTHVLKDPITGEVVEVNGGLQINYNASNRDQADPNDNEEAKSTTWPCYTSSGAKVYIHCDLRDAEVVGTPTADDYTPEQCAWASTVHFIHPITGETSGGWHAPANLRFWVSTSPDYATAKAEGFLVEVPTADLMEQGPMQAGNSITADLRTSGFIPLDISSDGRKVLVKHIHECGYSSSSARSNIGAGKVSELVFTVSDDEDGNIADVFYQIRNTLSAASSWVYTSTFASVPTENIKVYALLATTIEHDECEGGNGLPVSYVSRAVYEYSEFTLSGWQAYLDANGDDDVYLSWQDGGTAQGLSYVETETTHVSSYYDESDSPQHYWRKVTATWGETRTDSPVVPSGSVEEVATSSPCSPEGLVYDFIDNTAYTTGSNKSERTLSVQYSVYGTQGQSANYSASGSSLREITQTVNSVESREDADPAFGPRLVVETVDTRASSYNTRDSKIDDTPPEVSMQASTGSTSTSTTSLDRLGGISRESIRVDPTFSNAHDGYGYVFADSGYYEQRVVDLVCNKCVQPVFYGGNDSFLATREWISRGPVLTPAGVFAFNTMYLAFDKGPVRNLGNEHAQLCRDRPCAAYNPLTHTLIANRRNPVSWAGVVLGEDESGGRKPVSAKRQPQGVNPPEADSQADADRVYFNGRLWALTTTE